MTAAVTALIYGLLVLAGGVVGFKKAGSRPSLIAGIVSMALLLVAAVLLFSGRSSGAYLAIFVCAALLIFFGMRWMKNRRFMPSGLMSLVSAAALLLLLWTRPS
jgi:uncharacterized membrane protein (UPF0136 family)